MPAGADHRAWWINSGSSFLHVTEITVDGSPDVRNVMTYSQSRTRPPCTTDQSELFAAKRWVTERVCEHPPG